MGVPSFYKWLATKYPAIVTKAPPPEHQATADINGVEFDNLYLDMNGIIHPCFHPETPSPNAEPLPTTFEQVYSAVFDYIDHLFSIVRPRKLLFLAVDGVGPRAKMNQQRCRRYRSAKDEEIAKEEEERLRRRFEDEEGKPIMPKSESELSDSNVITPGTEFMFELSERLQGYVKARMESGCSGWKEIKVLISDANVPGEGEHKIVSFVRGQRSLPDYNPNTRHCLYGLDADLIILALATHEVHFSILREDVSVRGEDQPMCLSALKSSLSSVEARAFESRGWFRDVATKKRESFVGRRYEFLQVWVLREYLEIDMRPSDSPEKFEFDADRAVDDFVFICCFAGNDFLPRTPSLEIHEGALDLLMAVYKEHFRSLGGYLVDMQRVRDSNNAFIKLKRVEKFILEVGKYEEKIFGKRMELRDRKMKQIAAYAAAEDEGEDGVDLETEISRERSKTTSDGSPPVSEDQIMKNTLEFKERLRFCIRKRADRFRNGELVKDEVNLGADGWRKRYYKAKFSAETPSEIEVRRKDIVQKYTEGLLWVLQYYYYGVPSWNWYYPYHYGPFASDLKGLSQVKVKFDKGSPFKPFEQLMAVLPPRSSSALPRPYQKLMTDEKSSIIGLFPTDFEIDMDGKRFAWQGICKLPFVDERLLLAEVKKIEHELQPHETERNERKSDRLFIRSSSLPEDQLLLLASQGILTIASCGIGGLIRSDRENRSSIVDGRTILCLLLDSPEQIEHIPRPLAGTTFPDKTITESDIEPTRLWHEIPVSKYTRNQNWSRRNNAAAEHESSTSTNRAYAARFTTNPPPRAMIIKPAGPPGSGFSTGRGRGHCSNASNPVLECTATHHLQPRAAYSAARSSYSRQPNPSFRPHYSSNAYLQPRAGYSAAHSSYSSQPAPSFRPHYSSNVPNPVAELETATDLRARAARPSSSTTNPWKNNGDHLRYYQQGYGRGGNGGFGGEAGGSSSATSWKARG